VAVGDSGREFQKISTSSAVRKLLAEILYRSQLALAWVLGKARHRANSVRRQVIEEKQAQMQ